MIKEEEEKQEIQEWVSDSNISKHYFSLILNLNLIKF